MARTQTRTKPRSKPAPKRAIAKSTHRKVHTVAKSTSAHWLLGDNQAKALVARGITVAEALELCRIFKCTVAQLLLWYKVSKHKRHNVLGQARAYVEKHGLPTFPAGGAWTPVKQKAKAPAPPPPPRKRKAATAPSKKPPHGSSDKYDEVVWWIGDLCDVFIPIVDSVEEGQTVVVQRKDYLEDDPGKEVKVKVTNMYESEQLVGLPPQRTETKWSVVGRLQSKFIKYDGEPEAGHLLAKGVLVRFYVDHVKRVV